MPLIWYIPCDCFYLSTEGVTMLTGFPRTRWPRRRSYAVRISVKISGIWEFRVIMEQGEWLRRNLRYARVLTASFALLPRVLDEQHPHSPIIIPESNTYCNAILTDRPQNVSGPFYNCDNFCHVWNTETIIRQISMLSWKLKVHSSAHVFLILGRIFIQYCACDMEANMACIEIFVHSVTTEMSHVCICLETIFYK